MTVHNQECLFGIGHICDGVRKGKWHFGLKNKVPLRLVEASFVLFADRSVCAFNESHLKGCGGGRGCGDLLLLLHLLLCF
jgi:hypothetical protein